MWPPPAWSGGVVWSAVTRLVLPPGRCGWCWLLVAAGPGSGSGPGRARPRPAGGAALPVKLHSPHIGPRPQYTALPARTRQAVALIHQTLQKWWLYSSENITKIEDVYSYEVLINKSPGFPHLKLLIFMCPKNVGYSTILILYVGTTSFFYFLTDLNI